MRGLILAEMGDEQIGAVRPRKRTPRRGVAPPSLGKRAHQHIAVAAPALEPARTKQLHVCIASSDIHITHNLRRTREEGPERIRTCVPQARRVGGPDHAAALSAAGLAAGPCLTPPEVIADEHLAARDMLVEVPRPDGGDEPVLVPGNPVRMSKVAVGPEGRVPWLGEHTDEVLAAELGLDDAERARLREAGVIA